MDAGSWQKEQLSVAYLHAVASTEGLTVATWNVDKDGVDATIRKGGPTVDFQLKCTQKARRVGENFVFDLDVATYDKLRMPDRTAPGYLALMIVPRDLERWLVHDSESLLMRCVAYYTRLQDRPEAPGQTSVAIHLPMANRLDGPAMSEMIEDSRRRILSGYQAAVA